MSTFSFFNQARVYPCPADEQAPLASTATGTVTQLPAFKTGTVKLPSNAKVKDTDQQSPGRTHVYVAGLTEPIDVTFKFGNSPTTLAAMWALMVPADPTEYVAQNGGKWLLELEDPRGVKLRQVGFFTFNDLDKPEDDVETFGVTFHGSGRAVIVFNTAFAKVGDLLALGT